MSKYVRNGAAVMLIMYSRGQAGWRVWSLMSEEGWCLTELAGV